MSMRDINETGTRLDKLKELAEIIADQIDNIKYAKDLPPLARQYRETLAAIAQLEGEGNADDDIAALLGQRDADGKSGAVRKSRARLPGD